MTVYVVMGRDQDDEWLAGVYSTQEKAEAAAVRFRVESEYGHYEVYSVYERELDK